MLCWFRAYPVALTPGFSNTLDKTALSYLFWVFCQSVGYPKPLLRQLDIERLHPSEMAALQVLEDRFPMSDLSEVFAKKTWRFLFQGMPLYRIFLASAGLYDKDKGVRRAIDKSVA